MAAMATLLAVNRKGLRWVKIFCSPVIKNPYVSTALHLIAQIRFIQNIF